MCMVPSALRNPQNQLRRLQTSHSMSLLPLLRLYYPQTRVFSKCLSVITTSSFVQLMLVTVRGSTRAGGSSPGRGVEEDGDAKLKIEAAQRRQPEAQPRWASDGPASSMLRWHHGAPGAATRRLPSTPWSPCQKMRRQSNEGLYGLCAQQYCSHSKILIESAAPHWT